MPDKISLKEAAAIAGLTESHLSVLRHRNSILFKTEYFSPPAERGKAASVDRVGVIFLTIFAAVYRRGMPAEAAAEAAATFTEVGDTQVTPWRMPCELYAAPHLTLLIVAPQWDGTFRSRVVASKRDALFLEVVRDFAAPGQELLMVLDLNMLVDRVDRALAGDEAEGVSAA